jgi:hypothetical protein
MTTLYGLFLSLLFVGGGDLLYHLGRGSVPDLLKPVVNVCVKSGIELKWVNVALWMLFILIAGILLLLIGYPLIDTLVDMGRGR